MSSPRTSTRRIAVAVVLVAAVLLTATAGMGTALGAVGALEDTPVGEIPLPEPGFLGPVPAGECDPENAYEDAVWSDTVDPLQSVCKRLRFAYGPITVRPGQNDTLLAPVTIEKPAYDGYVLRFKPDLVRADGTPPLVDEVHLHHSVWLKAEEAVGFGFPPPRYDDDVIPFFASGEEKTTALLPEGYGYPVQDTDAWLLLYMVHNYTTSSDAVWITYDLDYVSKAAGDAAGITSVQPAWLDVQRRPITADAPDTPVNPVFNVQKGFGHHEDGDFDTVSSTDPDARLVCTWPDENCARFDAYGNVTPQQGDPVSLDGAYEPVDLELRGQTQGTLVWMGGHLHPGGVRNDVDLVRGTQSRRIFTSEAVAWSRTNPGAPDALGNAGGPIDSWDFSMTTTGAQYGWKVDVKSGDKFRINATYDSEISWYENMGIVVAFLAPGEQSGVDVFASAVTTEAGVPSGAPMPSSGWSPPTCTPSATNLCTRGVPTHGHLPESSRFGGGNVDPLPNGDGPVIDTVPVVDFEYGLADQGVIFGTGDVPRVTAGQTVRFVNADTAGDIWHTITRCQEPCTGSSGLAYPKADGGDSIPTNGDDFDSSEIGFGLFWSPAKVHVDEEVEAFGVGWFASPFSPPVGQFADEMDDGVLWEFTPDASDVGETVTFYCRIHIGMRGAVKVVT